MVSPETMTLSLFRHNRADGPPEPTAIWAAVGSFWSPDKNDKRKCQGIDGKEVMAGRICRCEFIFCSWLEWGGGGAICNCMVTDELCTFYFFALPFFSVVFLLVTKQRNIAMVELQAGWGIYFVVVWWRKVWRNVDGDGSYTMAGFGRVFIWENFTIKCGEHCSLCSCSIPFLCKYLISGL